VETPEGPRDPWEDRPPPSPEDPFAAPPPPSAELAVIDPGGPPSPPYEARFEIGYPEELNRWLPLVKWLLVIPHLFVLAFVAFGALFVAIYAWFAVLITGRWPRGAFDYLVGTARWYGRVVAYSHLMVDAYPPFSLQDDPTYPVRVDVEYPERIARWRPLVHWLLAIPYLLVAGALYWLTGVLTFFAFFTILFTRRIPRELFDLMVPGLRWNLRGNAYAYFMTERYPPFVWG
jgi:hypothetical protein